MVERVCQEMGLQYKTEHNEGRMYIDLTGGNAQPPSSYQQGPGQYDQSQYGKPHYQTAYPMGGAPQYGAWSQQQQGGYPAQQQQYQQGGYSNQQQQGGYSNQQAQGGQQQFDYEAEIKKDLPKIIRLLKSCCTVM